VEEAMSRKPAEEARVRRTCAPDAGAAANAIAIQFVNRGLRREKRRRFREQLARPVALVDFRKNDAAVEAYRFKNQI
jgi:hypothetical protein